jgi:YD repeat-containing protein
MEDLDGVHSYEYGPLYRLTEVTYPDQETDTYTYDAVGNRLTKYRTPLRTPMGGCHCLSRLCLLGIRLSDCPQALLQYKLRYASLRHTTIAFCGDRCWTSHS